MSSWLREEFFLALQWTIQFDALMPSLAKQDGYTTPMDLCELRPLSMPTASTLAPMTGLSAA
tara:strand:- start:113 stop:298 length:186 start_codon:yes stop_codon:yes gene_type:complete